MTCPGIPPRGAEQRDRVPKPDRRGRRRGGERSRPPPRTARPLRMCRLEYLRERPAHDHLAAEDLGALDVEGPEPLPHEGERELVRLLRLGLVAEEADRE